ncbi:MAG: hypothetical protein MUF00_16800 [Gemmatimonadaceae bacterium]|jgi:hypothetical protein|nr:hypothetical protein [Gemmatimonadaceae bacterium]
MLDALRAVREVLLSLDSDLRRHCDSDARKDTLRVRRWVSRANARIATEVGAEAAARLFGEAVLDYELDASRLVELLRADMVSLLREVERAPER